MPVTVPDRNGEERNIDAKYILLTMPEVDDNRYDVLKEAVKVEYNLCKEQMEGANIVAQTKFATLAAGETKEDLETLTRNLGLEDSVWFFGPCYDEQELGDMIYNADLCISPGNVGLTAMHTMVFGTPVLTHNDYPHQMPEFEAIQDEKTGTFFKAGDSASLADSIRFTA